MRVIQRVFLAFPVLLTTLWILGDPGAFSGLNGFFAWRNVLMQYSGVLGIGVMSFAMLLSLRPAWFERRLGGLDKLYRLHRWLGIAGLSITVAHWLLAQGPKWLVQLGWLQRGNRPPRPLLPEGSLQQWFAHQRGFAEGVGEWAFYAAVVLMLLALVKWFPYRRFFQTHRLLAVCYLALVFHSVVLLRFEYWSTPLGAGLALLMAGGCVGAVMALLRRHLGGRRIRGRVVGLQRQPEIGVLGVDIEPDAGWPGHEAGQFAFISFDDAEGPHPFTIASAWSGEPRLRFLIKALGDYTRLLPGRLRVGSVVTLEGPYGRFTFEGDARRQIWIGGGIGITPFLARLQALGSAPDGRDIDLFHSTAQYDPDVIARLQREATAAKVRLHVLWDPRDGRLDVAGIVSQVPDWREADVWFCGPGGFGRAIRDGLLRLGLPAERFHQELFEMR